MPSDPAFWAVIPAGGAGTRLWPLSRAAYPKFLLDLGDGQTLLQATLARLTPLAGDRVLVVTGAAHVDAVREQIPDLTDGAVLAEPSARDSMAAIGLAAAMVERRDPGAIIGSFAADHVIPDADAFADVVREAIAVADQDYLVTIGLTPTHPATGFGYIRPGAAVPGVQGAPNARVVESFVEKPDAATAASYVESGYRWNAGMFVVRAGVLLDLLARFHPDLAAGLRAIAADPDTLDEAWPDLTKISIDHAVAEPAAELGRVAVVPASFEWDDIGDFASLGARLPDKDGLRHLGEASDILGIDATGTVVARGGRPIAVLGLDDVVVVDTPSALLVTTRDRAQDVKAIVDALKAADRADLT